jgi:two-component system, cell cycle sensor histidine kinase and response regulator CckA
LGSTSSLEANIDSNDKKRILILEDDNDTLYLFGDALRVYGFEVDMFSDPDYALNSFLNTPSNYDLVLMDLRLGGKDGRTLYKKFKEFDSAFKICVLTGLEVNIKEFQEICPSFEEKFLIKKPVKISKLVETIMSILQ